MSFSDTKGKSSSTAVPPDPPPPASPRRRGGGGRRPEAALDKSTKFASAPFRADLSTGEVLKDFDPTLKWQMQAVARLSMGKSHRLRICYRHHRHGATQVNVRGSEDVKPYFEGLMTCGSVWVCPVCAAKIQAVRTLELRQALDAWLEQGGAVYMLTQTIKHNRRDVLEELLNGFTEALRKFKGQRSYTRVSGAYGFYGSIRALEVTHGKNGWHPHAHTILLTRSEIDQKALRAELLPLWSSAVSRAGLGEISDKAFSLQDASGVRDYLTKTGHRYQWGAAEELVKANSKSGAGESLSPWDMLRVYLAEPDQGQMLARFAEYGYNFHGKKQLVWSRGLRAELLGSEGRTDEQIAESINQMDPILAEISLKEWGEIRKRNLQGTVLKVVQEYGRDGLNHLLRSLNEA